MWWYVSDFWVYQSLIFEVGNINKSTETAYLISCCELIFLRFFLGDFSNLRNFRSFKEVRMCSLLLLNFFLLVTHLICPVIPIEIDAFDDRPESLRTASNYKIECVFYDVVSRNKLLFTVNTNLDWTLIQSDQYNQTLFCISTHLNWIFFI